MFRILFTLYKLQVCPCQFLLNINNHDASEQINVDAAHTPVKYGLVCMCKFPKLHHSQ